MVQVRSIFVIDDEDIRFTISDYLSREGFKTETFASVDEVLVRLQTGFPDMFVADLALPGPNSQLFYHDIKVRSGLPVIFTVPHDAEDVRLLDLELEAEDYITKPFSPRELLTRVRTVLRRMGLPLVYEEAMQVGNLAVNPNYRNINIDQREVNLTPQEYELLLVLLQKPARTFNRQELLDRVWGYDYVGDIRAVDNLVKRLRKKLRENGSKKNVKTVWGFGYRFED